MHNDEINAVILGRNFAGQMDAMFARDLAESEAITLEQWQERSLMSRVKELIARTGYNFSNTHLHHMISRPALESVVFKVLC